MKKRHILFAISVLPLTVPHIGCNNSRDSGGMPNKYYNKTFPTFLEVQQIAWIGNSKSNIIRTFGKPVMEFPASDGTVCAVYDAGPKSAKSQSPTNFVGFSIFYRNDAIVALQPTYGGVSSPQSVTPEASSYITQLTADTSLRIAKITNIISFFTVSDHAFSNGVYISTPALPNVGYVSAKPDFVVTRVKALAQLTATDIPASPDKHYGVRLEFNRSDALAFKDFTDRNVGRLVLIQVNNLPVAAIRVRIAIPTGVVDITGLDQRAYDAFTGASQHKSP